MSFLRLSVMTVWSLSMVVAYLSCAGEIMPSQRTAVVAVEQAHKELQKFIDDYGIILDYQGVIPTAVDCAEGRPNAIGWWSPIENGPMFTGVYMYAACERARLSGLAIDKEFARRLANGLLKCSSVSDVPGFIARGIATDGRSHYPLSSDDQVHPWFLGLFEYYRSGIPTQEEKALIAAKMIEVGNALLAKSWNVPCDGAFKGQFRGGFEGHMYRDVIRYVFILRALYVVSGDDAWLKRYHSALAGRPNQSDRSRREICALGYGPDREIYKGFEGWCMWMYVAPQLSAVALSEMENDPSLRTLYRDSVAANAKNALLALPDYQKFDNSNTLSFGEAHWRDVFTTWFPQKTQEDARKLSECDRYKPECKRKDYEHRYACQPLAAAAIAAFAPSDGANRRTIENALTHYDYSRLKLSRFFYAECAWFALAQVESSSRLALDKSAAAAEIVIPGQFGGRGAAVFAPAKFGMGLRADTLHESVLYPGCGNLRPDQGTVELWLRTIDDTKPAGGRFWRNIMTAPPLDPQSGHTDTQFSLGINTDHEKPYTPTAMTFTMKAGSDVRRIGTPTLDWAAGSDHHVVVSWGPRGMELFIDGCLVVSAAPNGKPYLSAFPAALVFGGHPYWPTMFAKMIVDEIKISDQQRERDYIVQAFRSARPPVMDDHTLLLAHLDSSLDAAGMVTAWKKAQTITIFRSAWQCRLDPELTQDNIFLTGENNELHAFASRFAASPEKFTIECTVRDFYGKEVFSASREVTLPARCTNFDLAVPLKKDLAPGYYTARLTLKDVAGKIEDSNQSFCLLDGPVKPGKILWGFNVYDDYYSSMDALRKMGIGLLRGHGVYFWPYLEPQKGQFTPGPANAFSAKAAQYGIRVLGILGNTPLWAGVPPDNLAAFVGGKNEEKSIALKECYRPRDTAEWSRYVAQTVATNRQVKDWEIWNEPDWHLPQTPGFGFGGTTEQYFELLKAAYATIKKDSPQSSVVFPGIACAAAADPNFVRDLLQLGALRYVDFVGLHPYGGNQFFKEQLDLFFKAGYRGPVWQSEFIPDCFLTEPLITRGRKMAVDQTRHIVRMLPQGISAYVIHSTDFYFPHGRPSEACFSVAQLFRKLNGLDFIRSPASDASIFADRTMTVLTLWGNDPVCLRSNVTKLILTDYMGFRRELPAPDGSATFTPGDFLYVEAAGTDKIDPASVRLTSPRPDCWPQNGSFDEFEGDAGMGAFTPLNWELSLSHRIGKMNIDLAVKHSGKGSLRLERSENSAAGKIAVTQKLSGLVKGRSYLLKAWIKTEKNSSEQGSAMITIWDREKQKLYGGFFITKAQPEFTAHEKMIVIPADASDNIAISCSLEGKMHRVWFDDISFSLVEADQSQMEKTVFIDLRPAANQALGDNTLNSASGRCQVVFGKINLARLRTGIRAFGPDIFRVEDGDKSCIILGGSAQPELPRETTALKVGAKLKTVNFLGTALHVTAQPGEVLGEALVRYADDSTAVIPFRRGREIDEWYPPMMGPGVRVAEKVKTNGEDDANRERAVFLASWLNPQPDKTIVAITLRSSGRGVWAVLAISGVRN